MTTLDKSPLTISSLALYIGIAIASFACYAHFSSLFFIADDFIWIERAKNLPSNPLSIFNVEGGRYFDPLVYLSFWLNYKLNGLDNIWYHRTDLLIHTGNSFLVAYLAMLLTKSKAAAFLSGLIFAVTPTNADAVLWLSSRVDTLAAQFYLSSIISYILYTNKGRKRFYLLSLIFYIASLSAKVTPLFLPIIILALQFIDVEKRSIKRVLLHVLPFLLISVIYLILLTYTSPLMGIQSRSLATLNIKEFLKAITVLFFPESLIQTKETFYSILSVLLLSLFLIVSIFLRSLKLTSLAFLMIMIIILPLLFMDISFIYPELSDPIEVLASIPHRLYLATAGFAILVGTNLSFSLRKVGRYRYLRYVMTLFLTVGIFVYGYSYIKERALIWNLYEKPFKNTVELISNELIDGESKKILKDLYVIGGPGKTFTDSIVHIYVGTGNTKLWINHINRYSDIPGIIYSTDQYQSAFWVTGFEGNLNITQEIQEYNSCIKRNKPGEICRERLSTVIDSFLGKWRTTILPEFTRKGRGGYGSNVPINLPYTLRG